MNKRVVGIVLVAVIAVGCSKRSESEKGNAASVTPTPAATQAGNAAAPATPGYRWEYHKGLNMKFELPNDWTAAPNGDVLVVKTPTPGVGIEFVAASGEVAAKSDEKIMLAEVGKVLKTPKFTSGLKPVSQHGLSGFVATGNGQKDGQTVDWFTAALGSGNKALLALGFYSPNAPANYKQQLTHVLDSIQPM